jgi:hypothetical protein
MFLNALFCCCCGQKNNDTQESISYTPLPVTITEASQKGDDLVQILLQILYEHKSETKPIHLTMLQQLFLSKMKGVAFVELSPQGMSLKKFVKQHSDEFVLYENGKGRETVQAKVAPQLLLLQEDDNNNQTTTMVSNL